VSYRVKVGDQQGRQIVGETFNKIGLYLTPWRHYWTTTQSSGVPGQLEYPIDFGPRLVDGHFRHFDEGGVPVRISAVGPIHNYTRICGFALAHWSLIGAGVGTSSNHVAFMAAADYLVRTGVVRTGVRRESELLLRAEIPGRGHVGRLSAMSQGQAMSVLVRAHELTKEQRYVDAAMACVGPFERPIDKEGVAARGRGARRLWFEEDTRLPSRHILNGMVFALWGLADVARATGEPEAAQLYASGLDSLRASVALYDTGWWSLYDHPDGGQPYVASMRYHELHSAQLQALGAETRDAAVIQAAERFAAYARSLRNRLQAAGSIAIAKLRGDFRHDGGPAT
jgi:heparosan-N-sulfate-glucuronate 5-epimerase